MSNTERRKILNYRNASGISPNPDNIDYGEIAIGYKKDNEAIYIKNTTNEIVDFTPISIVNLTYNELKNLRDNSKLKPSQYYRITDFVTTVANDPEARSAGHPFDIVLLALSANKLAEEGWAMMHDNIYDVTFADGVTKKCWIYQVDNAINIVDCESLLGVDGLGDDEITINQEQKTAVCSTLDTEYIANPNIPYNYFQNSKLAAWKIWYCLDNDITKYMWADTTNGKGVIYRMIDEWGNDCPYDFKNVQFKRYWANGINIAKAGETKDIILQGYYGTVSTTNIFTEGIDKNDYLFCFTFTRLNNILVNYKKGSVIQSDVLDESNQTEGLDTDAEDDKLNNPSCYKLHNRCRNNILKPTETGLVVDTKEYMTFVLLNNVFITVKEDDYDVYRPSFDNTLGSSCVNNTFGSNIYGVLFLSRCINNTFGNDCGGNSFGNDCVYNSFGNDCNYNSFGNECQSNSFGNNCNGNSFGNYYFYNSFGNDCNYNSFGNDCGGNSFGNNCVYNSFRNYCEGNSFRNYCVYNSFGNDCGGNSFGNNCRSNSFGNECGSNSFGNYFKYNALGNDIRYIAIPTEKIYNIQILNGTHGHDSTNKLTIAFTPETEYSQFAGLKSDGVLKIWVEADDPHDGIDCGNY